MLLTPENLPEVMTAVGGILGGGGLLTWWRVRREPPKPGSPDAAAVALVENTKALNAMAEGLKAQNTHFADNNDMFKALGPLLSDMKRDGAESRILLARICDALNHRAP